jgi:hypothetical protein
LLLKLSNQPKPADSSDNPFRINTCQIPGKC